MEKHSCSRLQWRCSPNTSHLIAAIGLFLCVFTAADCVHADIPAKWTGAEKFRSQLNVVRLEIETAPAAANTPNPATAHDGQVIRGTLARQAVPTRGRGPFALGAPETEKIMGHYFPEIGLLRFRIDGAWSRGATAVAVLNPAANEMALIYTGAGRNNPPFVLAAGDEFPADIRGLLPDDLAGLQQRQQQATTAQQAETDNIQKMQTLRLELATAMQNRDQQRAREIQQELLQLNQQMIERRKQQANQQLETIRRQGVNGSPQQQLQALQAEMRQAAMAGDKARVGELQLKQQQLLLSMRNQTQRPAQPAACPENIVSWVGEMDRQGASFQAFKDTTQLSNLFRPGIFANHFGTPFAEMSGAEKSEIAMALHRSCIRQGTDFYTSPNATAIQSAFGDGPNFSSIDAGIAGIALEMIARWSEHSQAQIEQKGDWQRVILIEKCHAPLLDAIWPKEAQAGKTRLATIKDGIALDALDKRFNELARQVDSRGDDALREIARLRFDSYYAALTQGARDRFDAQVTAAADRMLASFLSRAKDAAVAGADIAALRRNATWYRNHADILGAFAGTAAVKDYQKHLGNQRESVFKKLQPDMEAALKKLDTRAAVVAYGNDFILPLDNACSPTWRQLEAKRVARIAEVEWEKHVARVGTGPFDPHHPGAVYLNALYRNDLATLKEEDDRFATAFRTLARPINQSGLHQMLAMVTGGMFTAGDMQRYIDSALKHMSMADTLAGFFIVSYEHLYPGCMGDAVKMQRTVVWEKVTRDIFNDDPWDEPEVQTYHYNIKSRHLDVFKRVGEGKSPEELEIIGALFGGFFPTGLRESQAILHDVLKGLRLAMGNMACDDPDMQRLETNLLNRAVGSY